MDGESVCEDDKGNTNVDQVSSHDDRKQGIGIDTNDTFSIPCDPVEDKSLVFYEVETEEGYGVVRVTGGWIQVFWHRNTKTEVIAVDSRVRVRICDGGDWREVFQDCMDCIDMDSTGRRWEGEVKDGKPFGWGTLYNEDGLKEYEGFLLDTSRICYGKEYYPDICQIRYDGCYMNNRRFGEGILYDRRGEIEYDGLWKNDEPYSPRLDGQILTNRTEFFFITGYGFNRVESFVLPQWLHKLRRIVIGYHCFERTRLCEISGLSELEIIEIGNNSFSCCKLQSIQVAEYSFSDYHSLELRNLPSLQSIQMGEWCFYEAPLFSLVDCDVELNLQICPIAVHSTG
ncbi:hypothetical protein WA588_000318 [Blastocystis sp. NMH]